LRKTVESFALPTSFRLPLSPISFRGRPSAVSRPDK
jgi:hypothetical protein